MSRIINIETALLLFKEAAIRHAEATEQGDHKKANISFDQIVEAVDFLKSNNSNDQLLGLFLEPSAGVQMWAATYLLPSHEKESMKILNQIVRLGGILSLSAETTLDEWKKGNLKF